MDSTPELSEVFLVRLLEPTGLGRLAQNQTFATIEILPNQDPQGVLQLAPVDIALTNGVLRLEESMPFVNYQVTRSMGSFGEIAVAVETSSGTATSAEGESGQTEGNEVSILLLHRSDSECCHKPSLCHVFS